MKLILGMALTLPLCFTFTTAFAGAGGCDQQPVIDSFVEPGTSGTGKLCVLPNRLQGQVRLSNLVPGNAYTVWWTYQDDPSLCEGDTTETGGASLTNGVSPCEIGDFAPYQDTNKPLGIFGRMGSGVAPGNGRLSIRGELGGMQPSPNSEVWLWVFSHGTAIYVDGAALARQLLTPEDPFAGAPHLGNFDDCPNGPPNPGQCGRAAAVVVFTVD